MRLRYRAVVYRTKSKLKRVKVRLDLTKSLYYFLSNAINHLKKVSTIKFRYVDVNCRLKVKITCEDQEDVFCLSMDELRDITDMDI